MKKIFAILCLIIVLSGVVYSANTITVQETDKVELVPEGYDPDEDPINYSYSEPLDTNGIWQTTYGDQGEYTIMITASDGKLQTTEEVVLIVEKKEEPPFIETYSPDNIVSMMEGETVEFSVVASDLNNDELIYEWFFDDEPMGEGPKYQYKAGFFEDGGHIMKVIVSDSTSEVENEWAVKIEEVDRDMILASFYDMEVNETDLVEYDLPDFEYYELEYSISEPLGEDGKWQTGYDDSGDHYFTISIEDEEYKREKEFIITVLNKDRAPTLDEIRNAKIREDQKIEIKVNAIDEDGDEIEYYAENLPEGAKMEGDTFTWVTDYNTVKKENTIDKILDKFHLLRKDFFVTFVAKSNDLEDRKTVKITVADVNRAPVIQDNISEVIVEEGQTIKIQPVVNDLDGDKIKLSCSGWINECEYTTTYDDEGVYVVKVTASDHFLKDTQDITIRVNNVNREPYFKWIANQTVTEKEMLEFELEGLDSDGDTVTVSAISMPDGAEFDGTVFRWTPDIEFTNNVSDTTAKFKVSDGVIEIERDVIITVYNKNQLPVIINASPIKQFATYVGSQIPFKVIAEDPEGQELSYAWRFGLFEEHNATADHLRVFTLPGLKDVKVIISDGIEEIEYNWKVNVIEKGKKKKEIKEPVIVEEDKKENKTLVYKRFVVSSEEEEEEDDGLIYDKYTIVHTNEVEEIARERIII